MVSTGTLPQDIGTTFEKNFRSYLANPPPKNHFWHIRRAVQVSPESPELPDSPRSPDSPENKQ